MITPGEFVSLALDPVRLALLGAAAVGEVDADEVAGRLGVEGRRVRRELGKLMAAGLVAEGRLVPEALQRVARALPQDPPIDPGLIGGPWTEDEATVLSRFFVGRRLVSIPSARSKRLLVLERLALEFEPGLRYREKEVDFALQMFFADYATLRRYLIDEGFMTRADGVYWRTGGRTEGTAPS